MNTIYLDVVEQPMPRPTTSPSCGGLSTRWSFGMEVGRGSTPMGSSSPRSSGNGLCSTNEKISSLLYRGGGTFRNVETPTIWLDKGGQRILEVGGKGFLYVRVTCGCKVQLDTGCGVREMSLLIMEGELPEVVTVTNGVARDVEVEVGILRDPV